MSIAMFIVDFFLGILIYQTIKALIKYNSKH
jgi:hypothetical protein